MLSRRFIQVAGLCFAVSSITTLGLIFLPAVPARHADFEARTRLIFNPIYMTRRWIALVHPLIVVIGALGVAAVRFREAAGTAMTGFLFFFVWASTEAIKQALTLVAVDWTWRPQYVMAATDAERAIARNYIVGFEPLSDGLFFLLDLAFICANVLYVRAVWGRPVMQRVVAVCFGVGALLGIVSIITSFGGEVLPARVMDVLYPALQPAARFLIGFWLIRSGKQ